MKSTYLKILGISLGLAMPYFAEAQCPIPNSCTPGNATNAQAGLFGGGIYKVTLGGNFVNTTAGSSDGYKDYCNLGVTNIALGEPLSISVNTGTAVSENLRVYIDINNDQIFTAATELFFSSNNAKVHNGNITIPSGTTGQQIKMRITSDLISSAVLPGPCTTPEYSQVEDYAVSLVVNVNPPKAKFSVIDSVTCSGTVLFTDNSINNPTNWFWSFGDNQTSTSQNPSHTYSASGVYTVKLKVTNPSGSDSLTKTNYIIFNDTVPVAASCQPITFNQCCGYGITRVVIGSINNASAVGTYENFTCTQRTGLYQGRNYQLQIETNPNQNQDTKVWIDYNNNGQFEAGEVVFTALNSKSLVGTVLISSDPNVVKNQPLRMRVVSEYSGGIFNACDPLDKGQCEDYTVTILENNLPPEADFIVNTANFCQPVFDFTSQSQNVITSFHWFFGDDTDSVTTTPNIQHSYASTGTYDVTLVATGPFGTDTLLHQNAVTYFGAPAAGCAINTQQGGPQFQVGIAKVEFGTISKRTGNYTEEYGDFTCTDQTTVKVGQSLPLTVRNSSTQLEKVRVWIDWNGDGTFATSEQVMNSVSDTVHTVMVNVSGTAVINQTLRMRVVSNLQQAGQLAACGNVQVGQGEDYGIVVLSNNIKPNTIFGADQVTSCTGVIQFTDSTENIPTSYLWNFGDSQTSTQKSPVHTYTSNGTYTVKLVTMNAFGSDSLTKNDFIQITGTSGMVPANCNPAAPLNTCCQYGIGNVTFGGINNTSGPATEGNVDNTCGTIGQATLGTVVPISISNTGSNLEQVGVWIDWNNDGVFADAEKAFSSSGATTHAGNITIPGNATGTTGLRMRVKSDFNNQPLTGPCVSPQFGQIEDYQITLIGNNEPPIALFSADKQISCFNTIQFSDTSFNAPTSWKWYFGDGDSSILRNPSHIYPGIGTYTVELIVSNANGADTIEKIGYIVIQDGENLKAAPCQPSTVNTTNNPGAGISKVVFNTINSSSLLAPVENYVDNSCSNRTSVLAGQTYTITVTTNPSFNENCRVWIDWNNDGQFADPAERVLNGQNARSHTGAVLIPATARIDTALRMRIISDFAQGPVAILPCNNPNFGQCEDYSVIVQQNTTPPIAKISASNVTSCNGFIQFTDSSAFIPTTWFWSFGDNQTSPLQNPIHQYSNAGTYTVKLKVSNSFGIDSVEMLNYVTISGVTGPKPISCINRVTTLGQTGISRVRFGNLDKTTGFSLADGGYKDYTCSDSSLITILTTGQTSQLVVNTSVNQNCRVFIDFNNDGIFAINESVLNTQNNAVHNANFILTAAQCLGVTVRMRVMSDFRTNPIINACTNPVQGQVEDYAVKLVWEVANSEILSASQFTVYPNPSIGKFQVVLPSGSKADVWKLIDVQGKEIGSGAFDLSKDTQEIQYNNLPSGIYNLIIRTESGPIHKKVVIQK